jgi:hypothetical protein
MEFLSGIGDGVRLPWFYGPRWFFSKWLKPFLRLPKILPAQKAKIGKRRLFCIRYFVLFDHLPAFLVILGGPFIVGMKIDVKLAIAGREYRR